MRRRRKYKGYSNKHPFYLFPVLSTTSPPEDSSVLYDSFGLQKFNFVLYTELTCSWQHFWPSVPGRKLVGEYLLSSGFLGFSHLLRETKLGHSSLGRTMMVEIPLPYLPVDMAIKLELWLMRFRKEAKEWRWECVIKLSRIQSVKRINSCIDLNIPIPIWLIWRVITLVWHGTYTYASVCLLSTPALTSSKYVGYCYSESQRVGLPLLASLTVHTRAAAITRTGEGWGSFPSTPGLYLSLIPRTHVE